MNKFLKPAVGVAVSAIAVWYLFFKVVNLGGFLSAVATVGVLGVLLSDVPYFVQSLLMGYKIKYAYSKYGIKVSYGNSFFSHLLGMFFSNFSFGRAGYLGAIAGLQSDKPTATGIVSGIIVVDIISKGFLVAVSLVFVGFFFGDLYGKYVIDVSGNTGYYTSVGTILNLMKVLGFLFLALGIATLVWIDKSPAFLERISFFKGFRESFISIRKIFFKIFSFSIAGWLLRGIEWFVLMSFCGIHFSYLQCLILHPLVTSLRLIPISLSGLGIVEYFMIGIFPNIAPESLVAFTMLDMVNNSLVDVVGLKCLIWK